MFEKCRWNWQQQFDAIRLFLQKEKIFRKLKIDHNFFFFFQLESIFKIYFNTATVLWKDIFRSLGWFEDEDKNRIFIWLKLKSSTYKKIQLAHCFLLIWLLYLRNRNQGKHNILVTADLVFAGPIFSGMSPTRISRETCVSSQ